MAWNPAAASTLMVPGKSLAIISRTGQVWHPIGSPNGFARSSRAPAQSALATAACFAVFLTNSLLVIVDISPSKLGSKIHLLAGRAKHVRYRDHQSHNRTREVG